MKVVPTKPISPARAYVDQGRRLKEQLGIVFRKTGEAIPILEHAARNAFWRIPRTMLEKLAKDRGVSSDFNHVYDLVAALVQNILGPLSDNDLQDILATRGVAPPNHLPEALTEEVVEAVADKDDVVELKVLGGRQIKLTRHCVPPKGKRHRLATRWLK